MTSLRERIRRLLHPRAGLPPQAAPFSYRVYWTREVRSWDPGRRRRARAAVQEVLGAPGFEANLLERRFRVPLVVDSSHAGASLVALNEVLQAFEAHTRPEGGE
ncbi:MAG: hypothetical protein ACRDHY_08965 [Anaerolineales bacterium]